MSHAIYIYIYLDIQSYWKKVPPHGFVLVFMKTREIWQIVQILLK